MEQKVQQQIAACVTLLEATLGNMPTKDADNIVRGVAAILRAL